MQKLSAEMTPSEFLVWEREQPVRHHYIHGQIFDLAGGSARHNGLSLAVGGELRAAFKNGPCRALSNDQKIGVADDVFAYADVVVVCGPLEFRPGTKDVLTNPRVIVEVLSKSTRSYDLDDKKSGYLALPSVQHLLFVEQHTAKIEMYSRQHDGGFLYEVFEAGRKIELRDPKVALAVDEIYAGMFGLPADD